MRRKRSGSLLGLLAGWILGAAVAIVLGYYCIPSIYIHATPDGSWERVEVDWENTAGKRIVEAFRR